jgi:NhaP-type Na+/H+ or K+/H+ antiporter
VALALSLPAGSERNLIVSLTYVIVAVSILGQGLSIGAVIRRAVDCDETLTKSDKKSRPVISTTLTGLPSKNRKIIYDSA